MLSDGSVLVLGGYTDSGSINDVWTGSSECWAGYAPVAETVTCTTCPAGTACLHGVKASCSEGVYSIAGASSCDYTATTCPVDTYSVAPASCQQCAPYSHSTVGATTCQLSAKPISYWTQLPTAPWTGKAWTGKDDSRFAMTLCPMVFSLFSL